MASEQKLAFETLKADEVGRRLKTQSGRFEVAAKLVSSEEGYQFLVVRLWIGSEPGANATAGWSEPSTWSHTVYDLDHNVVAYGFGSRERDSWAMAEKVLGRKLSTQGHGYQATYEQLRREYEATGGITDPDYGFLEGVEPFRPERVAHFTWGPDDLELLTEAEARQAIGDDAVDSSLAARTVAFEKNDAGYLEWLVGNGDGFVANVYHDRSRYGLHLHRASCKWISGSPARGDHWTHEYIKVCAPTVGPVVAWVKVNVGGGAPEPCRQCRPVIEEA